MANKITLKWGILKSWEWDSPEFKDLLDDYEECETGLQSLHPTSLILDIVKNRRKQILFDLIDSSDGDTIYIHWGGRELSKLDAKKYVEEYWDC